MTDPGSVDALADTAYERFGHVSLLANNAGLESLGNLWEIPPGEWHRLISVNVNGIFHGVRSFVPRMGADPRPSSRTCRRERTPVRQSNTGGVNSVRREWLLRMLPAYSSTGSIARISGSSPTRSLSTGWQADAPVSLPVHCLRTRRDLMVTVSGPFVGTVTVATAGGVGIRSLPDAVALLQGGFLSHSQGNCCAQNHA